MACFYMIHRYVISKWRSIRPLEIHQWEGTLIVTSQWPFIMTSQWVNAVARDIHCDITMSSDIAMCTYHGITMHNDVAMNLFYYIFSALYLIMILLWVVWNKNKNKFSPENTFIVFVSLALLKYPYTNTTHVFSPDWSNTHLFLLYILRW